MAEITSLGLIQMTRKRIGTGLLEAFSTECPRCHGRGYELHEMPVESHRHADGGARDSCTRHRRTAQSDSGKATDNAISAEAADESKEEHPRSVLLAVVVAVAAAALLQVRSSMRLSRRTSRWC